MMRVKQKPCSAELVTDYLELSSLDDRIYRVVRLPNQLEALIVHDAKTDKASAAMDVNVGNFSDDADMPGIAHAVEHLLFMGTKKYPEENAYEKYLSAHSGSSNAYTAETSTNFFFEEPSEANPSPLKAGLDRFAQFFIEPLFLDSTVDRELRAVESENNNNLQSDMWRLDQLKKSLSNPAHPYCYFATGSLDTLKTKPEARGVNVRQRFIDFHTKHYSANRMKLVVLGREPLDLLETWVVEYFSGIEDKKLEPNRWPDAPPLGPEQLGSQIFVKPVTDARVLHLCFPFLDENELFESLPSFYISHLIGYAGPGSIMSYMKGKGWADNLDAEAYAVCPGSLGMFECRIGLTEEGLKNYRDIVKVFFQFVALLRETQPQKWIWEEWKSMADMDFKFRQKTPVSDFTSEISANMQKPLPREWLLSGTSRLRRFDPEAICKGIDCLQSENLRIYIVSRDYPGAWDKKEKWYATEYASEKIPRDFMDEIREAVSSTAADRISNLYMPHKNQFIPTKLEVEKKEIMEPAVAPTLVRNDSIARTWYKKDDQFWVPKVNLIVSCMSPVIYASAENAVKARILTDLVRDALEEYSYDAKQAGLQYYVSLDSRGLCLEVGGYNDKLPALLEQVLKTMRDLEIKEDRFAIIKDRVSRGYRNCALEPPFHQVGEYTYWLTTQHSFTVEEFAAELPIVTCETTRAFQKEMLSQLYIEAMVHGNVCKDDALGLTDMLEQSLKARPLPKTQWPICRSFLFRPGSNYVFKKMLGDPANVNHCIEYLLFVGEQYEYMLRSKVVLLSQILREPAFDQLRTKEQLGYIVFSGIKTCTTTLGFHFIIQSEKTPQYLETRIESFLTTSAEMLKAMSNSDFEGHKQSIIIELLEKTKNLGEETNRLWDQVANEYYDFDLSQKTASQVKQLTKQEMVDFFNHYINPASPARAKLAVWMIAQATSDTSTKQILELIKALDLASPELESQVAMDLQARLSVAGHDEDKEVEALKEYLLHNLKFAKAKVDVAAEVWTKLLPKADGLHGADKEHNPPSLNGTAISFIEDLRDFKTRLPVSAGARPVKDLIEYGELDPKL